jgi:hypothetical protein
MSRLYMGVSATAVSLGDTDRRVFAGVTGVALRVER